MAHTVEWKRDYNYRRSPKSRTLVTAKCTQCERSICLRESLYKFGFMQGPALDAFFEAIAGEECDPQ